MRKDKQCYLAWRPGAAGYCHDDTIIAVGLQCGKAHVKLSEIIAWIVHPDKVCGNAKGGHLAYFFDQQAEVAAMFDVVNGQVKEFGTITRAANNAKRIEKATGEELRFNMLDTMDIWHGSEMEKNCTLS